MSKVKYIPLGEFVEGGFLQELNRQFLHPLGLALEVNFDGERYTLTGVQDSREDPEGIVFQDLDTDEARRKAENVAAEFGCRAKARTDGLGFVVQPIPGSIAKGGDIVTTLKVTTARRELAAERAEKAEAEARTLCALLGAREAERDACRREAVEAQAREVALRKAVQRLLLTRRPSPSMPPNRAACEHDPRAVDCTTCEQASLAQANAALAEGAQACVEAAARALRALPEYTSDGSCETGRRFGTMLDALHRAAREACGEEPNGKRPPPTARPSSGTTRA